MHTVLVVAIIMAMLATLGTLGLGLVTMFRGGGNPQRSNKLMQMRVVLQGIALLLLAILMMLYHK